MESVLTTSPSKLCKQHQSLLEKFRAATIKELKRTDAGMVNNLPPVGTKAF